MDHGIGHERRQDQPHPLPRPLHCDWAWRADPWRVRLAPAVGQDATDGTMIGPGVSLHHDDARARIGWAQQPRPDGPAPFGLQLAVGDFSGSFLSLAVALPDSARQGLRQRHLVGLSLAMMTAPAPAAGLIARLNIRHGPNTARALREIPADMQSPQGALVEFDLAYCPFTEQQVSHVWCDLIFGGASPCEITLLDLAFTRRPRAEI